MPAHGGLDLQRAMEIVDGDRDLLKTLMGLFLAQFAAFDDELRAALGAAEPGRAAQKIHQLAGAAVSIGARRLGMLAQELEGACRAQASALHPHAAAGFSADTFLSELTHVLEAIHAYLENSGSPLER